MIALYARAAVAWDVNDQDWSWQDAPVEEPFLLNVDSFVSSGSFPDADADRIEALFAEALERWNAESDADLLAEYGGRTTVTRQGNGDDEHNVSVFGSRNFGAGLAVATTNGSGARLTDCDISFHERNGYGRISWNTADRAAPYGVFDLANTFTHELGHCLGLAHSQRRGSIMYAYVTSGLGEADRHLTDDDRAAIQHLYGAVAPELVLDGAVAGDVVDGEVTVTATVRNVGDGTAYGVLTRALGQDGAVARIGADTPVGRRAAADTAEVAIVAPADCEAGEAAFELQLRDGRGRGWRLDVAAPVDCPADPPGPSEPTEPDPASDPGGEPVDEAGCGCAARPGGPPGLAAALVLAVAARRRAPPSPRPGARR